MTAQVVLPGPVTRVPALAVDVAALERDLSAEVDGEVRFDAGSRGAYSTDAPNHRQVPIGVVVPRTVEAAVAAVAVCREHRRRGRRTELHRQEHRAGEHPEAAADRGQEPARGVNRVDGMRPPVSRWPSTGRARRRSPRFECGRSAPARRGRVRRGP
ncbi:hypothetical protein [Streptosporangium jomthongense]|uniref:Uncharacterized protein n=1 Tax=Streptosporangium jomthongense TaxID=1193683 RepID=A0ABV8ESZ4_9ACTN